MSETGAGMLGAAFAADFWAGDMSQVGLTYQRRRVTAFGDAMQSQRIGARLMTRPRRDVRIAVTGGMWSPGFGKLGGIQPEATVRLRKTPFTHAGMMDIRLQHLIVDVTPDLVRAPVRHSMLSTAVDVPIAGPLSIRGHGRVAALSRATNRTSRVGVGGGIGVALSPAMKVSGQWHGVRHSNPFVTGYFAPRFAELVEGGLEIEREFDRASVSLDLGGGVQRVARAGTPLGPWAPSFRGWGLFAWTVGPARQLLIEFEAYNSRLASVVSPVETWRYAAVSASMRIALRQ